jgi:hypothetical protein
MNTPIRVSFKILSLNTSLNIGSTLSVGAIYLGLFYPLSNTVFFTDDNGQEHSFRNGDSCQILSNI